MSANNKEIVEKVNASFAEGGVESFLSFCADDVVWTIIGDRTVKGKGDIRERMASMDIEPPKVTVENIIGDGDFATCYGNTTMNDKDGKAAPYAYCDIYRFRNIKIAELNSVVIKAAARAESASGA